MAQKIQTLFIDDLDGSEAEGTVRFGLDGAHYEIDLNSENAAALRGALGLYVEHGRRASNGAAPTRRRTGLRREGGLSQPAGDAGDTATRREYLRLLGHEVNDRGRIPAHLASIDVPPRAQWPHATPAQVPTTEPAVMERSELAEPADKSAEAVASEAADAILAEPAEAEPVKSEAYRKGTEAAAKPARSASGYDQAFRDRAVRAALADGATITGTAREYAISEGSLRNWIKAFNKAEAEAATSGASTPAKGRKTASKK